MCAVGYAVARYIIDNDVPANARTVGQYAVERLWALKSKYPFIKDVRGKGLLIALEFDRNISQDMMMACLKEGMLVNNVKPSALRFMPPLTIGNKEVDEAVEILDRVLSQVR